jgi:hypothetical protein
MFDRSIYVVLALLILPAAAFAQRAAPLAEAELSSGFAIGQVIEASRSNGVLTVRVAFAAPEGGQPPTGAKRETIYSTIGGTDYRKEFYVIAGKNRHLLLADTEGTPLAVRSLQIVREGDKVRGAWWGKFPAPDESIKKFSMALPGGLLFDDVPISDD